MVEGFTNKFAKFLLFAFNVIFVIAGAILIIIGAVTHTRYGIGGNVPLFIIVIGVIIFVVAFLGCCGAIRESRRMLLVFSVLLLLILLLCLAGAILGFIYKSQAQRIAHDILLSNIKHYNETKEVTDAFQKENQCCGISNYTDWSMNEFFNETLSVPDSCCKKDLPKTYCGAHGLINITKINTEGCIDSAQNLLDKTYLIIGAVAFVIGLVIVVGIVLSCCLANAVRKYVAV